MVEGELVFLSWGMLLTVTSAYNLSDVFVYD